MRRQTPFLLLTLVGVLALPIAADTLRLNNGSELEGTFLGGDARTVRFLDSAGNVQSHSIGDIEGIRFGSGQASAPVAPQAPRAPRAPAPPRAAAAPAPARAASGITIPAGMVVTVRMIDSIDSDITGEGERFRASIDDPIVVDNQVVIPRNADATVQVVRVSQAGAVRGADEISLKLFDITVDGRSYELATNYAEVKSGGKGKSTAKTTALTTGVGAALGAIFGGGKGAAVGVGAGVGMGVGSGSGVGVGTGVGTGVGVGSGFGVGWGVGTREGGALTWCVGVTVGKGGSVPGRSNTVTQPTAPARIRTDSNDIRKWVAEALVGSDRLPPEGKVMPVALPVGRQACSEGAAQR